MKKIIIIEDDRDILEMMEIIIGEEGFEIISIVENPSIDFIRQTEPKLILQDNRLQQGISGSSFCKSLKDDPLLYKIPIVLISASPGLQQIADECGADDFMTKPFDLEDLINMVKKHVPSY